MGPNLDQEKNRCLKKITNCYGHIYILLKKNKLYYRSSNNVILHFYTIPTKTAL